jgi:inosine-uridine nucleoside N-ribohydrolase
LKKKHIIIDTDAGQDDLMAIALLMNCPGIIIDAVTVCNGLAHVASGAANVARLFAMTSRNTPVYVGHPAPMQGERCFPAAWRKMSDELPGVLQNNVNGKVEPESAVTYLLRRCVNPSEPLYILALGPLTNLALVYQQNPAAFNSIKEITLMGGAFLVPGNVFDFDEFISPTKCVEWNFFVDPPAAHIVCSSGVPMIFVPLDATNKVSISNEFTTKFNAGRLNESGKVVGAILHSAKDLMQIGEYYAWDPLAALTYIDNSAFQFAEAAFDVLIAGPDAGQTRIASNGACHALVALDADRKRFFDVFVKAFTEK